eukprot:CAMPEP_0194369076 /NCGR_PEP_ID=MMETSP0174-20130528/17337_1 /TAXON_ID=216777 /ORGANISM="Proboscia alata, Strain PI-D3" /LENGTH=67 /DNA_ID=CAMNT_0039145791 /DNA_START=73 /DNA_END=273 /DNA_ORIENTATION=-
MEAFLESGHVEEYLREGWEGGGGGELVGFREPGDTVRVGIGVGVGRICGGGRVFEQTGGRRKRAGGV